MPSAGSVGHGDLGQVQTHWCIPVRPHSSVCQAQPRVVRTGTSVVPFSSVLLQCSLTTVSAPPPQTHKPPTSHLATVLRCTRGRLSCCSGLVFPLQRLAANCAGICSSPRWCWDLTTTLPCARERCQAPWRVYHPWTLWRPNPTARLCSSRRRSSSPSGGSLSLPTQCVCLRGLGCVPHVCVRGTVEWVLNNESAHVCIVCVCVCVGDCVRSVF